ncbi:MAG TPA: apolipoprotein N-acyltransferase [Usitatibacter sp.]|nr:apolipoprotein N-acyltransferase [Usitatibacter sp.]
MLLPLLAGAAGVLGFAPFYIWPAPILAMAVLLGTWQASGSPLQAALSGFAFGLGLFLAGVSWVFVSLHFFGGMPLLLAALATFLFCAYLALFPALAGWATLRFAGGSPGARLALGAAAFVACEWLRGTLFTGFPWLTFGTSQVPSSPLAGFAPVLGGYGVSLAMAIAAALMATWGGRAATRRSRLVPIAALALLFALGGALRFVSWTTPAAPAISVALLQGNVPQQIKWQEEVRTATLLAYRDMIFRASAQVVVLPETALPAFLDQLPEDYLRGIREHARREGKEVLLGIVERDERAAGQTYYNSLVRLTGAGGAYRKRHLVPFGEFIPPGFRFVLAVLHIPMSDFNRGGARQAALEAAGTRFGVAICYEDIFGEEVIDALPAAQVLLNVSNDAWFGESWAAEQHLQASQMRALETGRWMLRATNTGVTAAIDERGHVVSRLAPFITGTLVAQPVPRAGSTPYALAGNVPVIVLLVVVALAASGRVRWRGSATGTGPAQLP